MIAYPKPNRERPLHWVGSAKKNLLAFPEEVIDNFGYALGLVQQRGVPPSAKPWKGEGAGVFELIEDQRGDTFRLAYTVHFDDAVYVLHCFQKKSRQKPDGTDRCGHDSPPTEGGQGRL